MASIVLQPNTPELQASGRPICFKVQGSATTVSQTAELTVITVNGNKTFELPRTYSEMGLFTWDFSQAIKDFFSEYNMTFNPLGGVSVQNDDRFIVFSVMFTDWELDATTGKKEPNLQTQSVSSLIYVANSCIEHPLNGFTSEQLVGGEFLTNKERGEMCPNSTEWLTALNPTGSTFVIIGFRDSTGAVTGVHIAPMDLTIGSYNVGPTNPDITVPPNTAYYIVTTSNGLQEIRYSYNNKCCCDIKIHFLNCYMAADTVNFCDLFRSPKGTSKQFQKCLPKVISNTLQIGTGRYNIDFKNIYKAAKENVQQRELQWLDDLLSTRAAYWEKDGLQLPIVVLDTASNEYNKRQRLSSFEVSFQLANTKPTF